MVPWILRIWEGEHETYETGEKKALETLTKQIKENEKKWHVGMGVLCLCYCSYIMLYHI
jgi:hypothetical protein